MWAEARDFRFEFCHVRGAVECATATEGNAVLRIEPHPACALLGVAPSPSINRKMRSSTRAGTGRTWGRDRSGSPVLEARSSARRRAVSARRRERPVPLSRARAPRRDRPVQRRRSARSCGGVKPSARGECGPRRKPSNSCAHPLRGRVGPVTSSARSTGSGSECPPKSLSRTEARLRAPASSTVFDLIFRSDSTPVPRQPSAEMGNRGYDDETLFPTEYLMSVPKLTPAQIRAAAERLPRVRLAHLPTPLEKKPRGSPHDSAAAFGCSSSAATTAPVWYSAGTRRGTTSSCSATRSPAGATCSCGAR